MAGAGVVVGAAVAAAGGPIDVGVAFDTGAALGAGAAVGAVIAAVGASATDRGSGSRFCSVASRSGAAFVIGLAAGASTRCSASAIAFLEPAELGAGSSGG